MGGKWVTGREVLRSRNWGKSLTGMNVVENDVVFMEVLVVERCEKSPKWGFRV